MGVWITILGIILFLGFATATFVCYQAIEKQSEIVIHSRLHHKVNCTEVICTNLGLVLFGILLYIKYYTFVPAVLMFVVFILASTRIKSGVTEDGAMVGTTYLEWDEMDSYKLVNEPGDSNIIILKIRAHRKQYVLVCDRKDRIEIANLFRENGVKVTEVMKMETTSSFDDF